jgi:hypothetical protein
LSTFVNTFKAKLSEPLFLTEVLFKVYSLLTLMLIREFFAEEQLQSFFFILSVVLNSSTLCSISYNIFLQETLAQGKSLNQWNVFGGLFLITTAILIYVNYYFNDLEIHLYFNNIYILFYLIFSNVLFLLSKNILNAFKMYKANLSLSLIFVLFNIINLAYTLLKGDLILYFILNSFFMIIFFVLSVIKSGVIKSFYFSGDYILLEEVRVLFKSLFKYFIPSLPAILPTSYLLYILKTPMWNESIIDWSISQQIASVYMVLFSYKYIYAFNDYCKGEFNYQNVLKDFKNAFIVIVGFGLMAVPISLYFDLSLLFVLIIIFSFPFQVFNGLLGVKYSILSGFFSLKLNLVWSFTFIIFITLFLYFENILFVPIGYCVSYIIISFYLFKLERENFKQ